MKLINVCDRINIEMSLAVSQTARQFVLISRSWPRGVDAVSAREWRLLT